MQESKLNNLIMKIERYGMENFTKISVIIGLLIILLFLYQQVFCIINNYFNIGYNPKTIDLQTTLIFLGGIIAFWYGYKKYERDKEIELLIKYNDIRNKEIKDFYLIFGNYSEIFYLKYNNYISEKLFNDIELILDIEFNKLFEKEINNKEGNIADSILKYCAVFNDGGNKEIRNNFSKHLVEKFEKWINNENDGKFEENFTELQKNNHHKVIKKKLLQLLVNALVASNYD